MTQLPNKENDALRNLINNSMLEQPSDMFTAAVMNKLAITPAASVTRYEPVIGRNGWLFIGFITCVFFFLALSGSTEGNFSLKALQFQAVLQQSTSVFQQVFTGPVILLLTLAIIAIFILIGAESWYRQSRLRTT